jgi:F-type H+-transporting ATPase subunit epsilon
MINFDLVSPERRLRSGPAHMVVVPGGAGDFGVLVGHAPLISTIRPGAIAIYAEPTTIAPERIFVDGGFAEVGADGLTVLAERAVPVGEIDAARVADELAAAKAAGDEPATQRLAAMLAVVTN